MSALLADWPMSNWKQAKLRTELETLTDEQLRQHGCRVLDTGCPHCGCRAAYPLIDGAHECFGCRRKIS